MGPFWIEKKDASGRSWAVQNQEIINTVQDACAGIEFQQSPL